MYKNQGSMYLRPPKLKPSGRTAKAAIILPIIILIWSILFLLIGLTLAAGGIYLFFQDEMLYPYLDVLKEMLFDLRILVVVFGAIVTLCSLICVLGVCIKRRQLLQVYCYTVILLLLMQFGLALFTFLNKQNLIDILHYECMSVLRDTPRTPLYSEFFTRVQSKLECCGCVAPADYSKLQSVNLPDSCYTAQQEVHTTGCLPAFYQLIEKRSTEQIITGSVAAVLLLLIVLAINCHIVINRESFREGSGNRVTPSPTPSPSRTSTVNTTTRVSNSTTPGKLLRKSSISPAKDGTGVQRIMVREHSF